MAYDFKKLFADKAKYPDTLEIQVGEATVSLADLREYDASVGGELQKQMKALQDDRAKLETASQRVAQTYIDLEAQRRTLEATPAALPTNADPLAKYEADEVFRPVVQHMRGIESKQQAALDKVTQQLDQVVKSIAQMGTTYMGDKARMDYSAIPADDPVRPKDLSLDALYKFAVEQRVYDQNNLPDLRTAYKKLTADARAIHNVEEARRDERAKVLQELQEGAMLPRPTSGMPALPEGMKPPLNMQDAFSKAGQDKDMWKQINNAVVNTSLQ